MIPRTAIALFAAGVWLTATTPVATQEDVTPPSLVSVSVAPATVDVTAGPAPVFVTIHLTDDLSGISQWVVTFASPSGTHFVQARNTPIAGTVLDATFVGSGFVAEFSQSGVWRATDVTLVDRVGNHRSINAVDAGLSLSFTVVSNEDLQPPAIASLAVDAASVDVTAGLGSISVTGGFTDDVSGVAQWVVTFASPSGVQFAQARGNPGLLTGTLTAGTFSGTGEVQQYAESGIWTATDIAIVDRAGNHRSLDATAGGFPMSFTVISVPDVTPPSLVNVSISPLVVDVRTSEGLIGAETSLTDDVSGVGHWVITFTSPSGNQLAQVRGNNGLVSGTDLGGTFHGMTALPQFSESGWWTSNDMAIVDKAGNHRAINLADAGFPLAFFVVGADSDTTPPVLTVSSTPRVLWSPNHKLVEIAVTLEATDDSDLAPIVHLVSIASNEPDNGLGDGDRADDIQEAELGTDDRVFLLRAERGGNGTGRIYTVVYRATDAAGNSTDRAIQVLVPLIRRE